MCFFACETLAFWRMSQCKNLVAFLVPIFDILPFTLTLCLCTVHVHVCTVLAVDVFVCFVRPTLFLYFTIALCLNVCFQFVSILCQWSCKGSALRCNYMYMYIYFLLLVLLASFSFCMKLHRLCLTIQE